MAAKIQGKLRPSDFGPKRLLGQKDEVKSFDCGAMIGVATGITRGELPNGDKFYGFVGAFEYRDTDKSIDPKASGKLFLPEGISAMILDQVEQMETDRKDTGIRAQVTIALKVSVQRAANPAGYEWVFEPVLPIGTNDPLASLRGEVDKVMLPESEKPAQVEHKKPPAK